MDSKFTSEMVDDYADKLLIGLTREENQMVLDEFEIIDKNIDVINEIPNIEEVEPMSWCLDDFSFELREDEVEESVEIDELLQNCDVYNDREVEVPKVVE
ncbi:MAG: hypothetical protein HFI86_08395 [Bacilli bacterium]|nr:hypothetical protein [Bacilli bacterium]